LKNNNIDFDASEAVPDYYPQGSSEASNPHLEAELKDLKIDRAKIQKELRDLK
jgi:hypothetical protein